ncbi:three component ABC system middle component [Caulobacter segnis]
MIAHDVYAETNPAWLSYVLVGFLRGFVEADPAGPELPLAYVCLPLCLSGDLASTFDGSNKKTGLREWIERSPQIQLELSDRLNGSMEMVTGAVRLACFSKTVRLEQGRLLPGPVALKADLAKGLSLELSGPVKRADRLGFWVAASGSTKTAFDILGLSL